jgi:hypothetical protein
MSVCLAHLKLTVRDLYHAEVGDEDNIYICRFYNTSDRIPTLFRNCRISGVVTGLTSENSYYLDDGTGVIEIHVPETSRARIPAVGDYVEVLGRLDGNICRSITLLCSNIKTDPMEEVKFLLEQAAIHRDMLRYKHATQDTRFLSSEASQESPFEHLNEIVSRMFERCGKGEGISFDQVKSVCGDDEDVAQRVINALQNDGIAFQQGDVFFPL